ncbi:MAG: tetratricopeptide repeat protein [Bacteroidia bacterium]|nr:tetratricopeptide repeat protein [Bacteroidia bacterium]
MLKPKLLNTVVLVVFLFILTSINSTAQDIPDPQQSPNEIKELAIDHYLKGNHDQSIRYYNQIIDDSCMDADLIGARAMSYLAMNNSEMASEDMNRSFALDPENSVAEIVRLRMIFTTGEIKHALMNRKNLRALQEEYPNSSEIILTEALFKKATNDIVGAIASLDNAIELNPNSAYLYMLKGQYLMETPGVGMAKIAFEKALDMNKIYPDAQRGLGLAYVKLGENSEALDLFDNLIKINPKDLMSLFNRGVVKNNLSDFEGAIEDFNRVMKMDKSLVEAYFHRSHAYFNLRNYTSSIKDLDAYLSINGSDPVAYSKRAMARIMNKDREGACRDLQKADELGDPSAIGLLKSFCN